MKWTDKAFEKLYWETLCQGYRRPNKQQLESASRYFLYNFVRGDGNIKDWEATVRILLFGLHWSDRISQENKNLKKVVDEEEKAIDKETYVLANYCEQNENAQSLSTPDAYISMEMLETQQIPKDLHLWYAHYVSKLKNCEYDEVSLHFGCMSLILCQSITHNPKYVEQRIRDTLCSVIEMLGGGGGGGDGSDADTENKKKPPPPVPPRVNHVMGDVFEPSSLFTKEIVCRLVRRYSELRTGNATDAHIGAILKLACLNSMYETGSGLYYWFLRAKKNLCIDSEDFFEVLEIIGGFDDVIVGLKLAKSEFMNAPKTWKACQLLQKKACAGLSLGDKNNMKAFGVFIGAASKEKCDSDVDRYVHSMREFPICPTAVKQLSTGIDIGHSIQRAVKNVNLHV